MKKKKLIDVKAKEIRVRSRGKNFQLRNFYLPTFR